MSGLQLLATHCSLWAATFDRDAPLVRDLLSQLTEHVRTIGVHVSHLLQVCEVSVKKVPSECLAHLLQVCEGSVTKSFQSA